MKRGFTLLELLTCISIIVIVASISYPAFSAIKTYAKRSAAASNLRQLYMGVALYRTDLGGDGIYGDAAAMGIPADSGPYPTPYITFMNGYKPLWLSPCGLNTSWFPLAAGDTPPLKTIVYRPSQSKTFGQYATNFRENTLLFFDLNCDDPDAPIGNKFVNHRGVGVLTEGQLVTPYKPGLMDFNDYWWSTPPGG